jgi:hypothetical protein
MSTRSIASLKLFALGLLLAGCWVLSARAQGDAKGEGLPPGTQLIRIESEPTSVRLQTPFEYTQLVLRGHLDNGDVVDITRLAKLDKVSPLTSVSERGLVRPKQNGDGTLDFAYAGKKVSVPVSVSGQNDKPQVSFVKDVMPVISKVGCNAGTCHGSAQGKNGFQLSLRGYDPLFDHRALVDDVAGRRFNRAAPGKSLMLMKPAGEVPHVGGMLTKPGEPYYELLRLWIAEGVKLDLNTSRVKSLEIVPGNFVIPLPGMKQQMRVIATYTDGSKRDVSAEAFVDSSNIETATVDKQGLVTALRRGEVAVMARYEGTYTAATLVVMGDRSGFAWKDVAQNNYIDGLVYEKLKQVKVLPSELCSDTDFIRRIYLDLIGLPPELEQVKAFLADPRPTKDKRDQLIDQLIGSPEFVEHWTSKWCDLLQCNTKFLGGKGAQVFRDWIKQAVAGNMPHDKFAYELLTANGSNLDNPPAAYFKILRDPTGAMENTTHLFLGVRFNCNKCHDHPFERWTQDQYYELSSFFAQIERQEDPKYKGQKIGGSAVEGAKPLVEVIKDKANGEVTHLRTGETAKPTFPFTLKDQVAGNQAAVKMARRQQLAHWVTSVENPYFARSQANRIWSYLLGVGLIEPVDDIRAGNPPSNPKLLAKLTDEFIKSGFNTQELIRVICKSRTYQHSIKTNKWNKDDDINYSHALARRLTAEMLYDAIHKVTGSQSKLPGLPPGARAGLLLDPSVPIPFLDQLGKPARESACECERSSTMLLGPILNFVNGPVLGDALKDPANRIHKLCAQEKNDGKVVEELFLTILNRPPSPAEMNLCVAMFHNNKDDYAKLAAKHAKLVDALTAHVATLDKKQPAWEEKAKNTPVWITLVPEEATSKGGATLTKQPDHSIVASGKNPTPETYVITVKTDNLAEISAYRLEVLADPSLPAQGPGRAPNGNFVLNEFKVYFSEDGDPKKFKQVKLKNPKATFAQDGFAINLAIDDNLGTGWAIAPQLGKTHLAAFEAQTRVGTPQGVLKFELIQQYNGTEHNIGKFRLSATTQKPPVPLQGLAENIAKILNTPADKRTKQQQDTLTAYYRSTDTELAQLQRSVADLVIPPDSRTMAAQDIAWALINTEAFLFNH